MMLWLVQRISGFRWPQESVIAPVGSDSTGWGLTMKAIPGRENKDLGTGETAQWVTTPLEHPGLISCAHMTANNHL